jgi:branched-chain amino acid transport system substrate-binding protein
MGPRFSSDGAVQYGLARHPSKMVFVQSNVPGTGYIAAGSNGWVVLNFTPPEALVILQAAQKLGLEDRVKGWGCLTPCDTDFLATALGPEWNHKLFPMRSSRRLTPPTRRR